MTIIAETKVQYNRSGRQWEAWDDVSPEGEATPYDQTIVIGVPAGPD